MNAPKLDMSNALYTDLGSLQQIKRVGKQDKAEGLREVTRQFETMFVQMMLKSMRDANAVFEQDNPTNSSEMQFHRDTYDQQLALSLTSGKGIGLAEQLYRQMQPIHGVKQKAEATPAADAAAAVAPAEGGIALPEKWRRTDSGALVREAGAAPVDMSPRAPVPPAWLEDFAAAEALAAKLEGAGGATAAGTASTAERSAGFSDRVSFLRELYPHAEQAARELGVEPKWLLAQAALETGWGQRMVAGAGGRSSNNLFNIKAGEGWAGERMAVSTLEYRGGVAVRERAEFRAYDSYADSFADYVRLLRNERYASAVENGTSALRFAQGLQRAGYATDPAYGTKIARIAGSDEMTQAWRSAVPASADG